MSRTFCIHPAQNNIHGGGRVPARPAAAFHHIQPETTCPPKPVLTGTRRAAKQPQTYHSTSGPAGQLFFFSCSPLRRESQPSTASGSPQTPPQEPPQTSAITTAYGADAAANRNTAKDSWNVRLKIHDPTGELYYLSFTRKDLKISSYESDTILAKVETWADSVAALN